MVRNSAKRRKQSHSQLRRNRRAKLRRIKKFLTKNAVSLGGIILSTFTALTIYYLAYSEPDIRPVTAVRTNTEFSSPTRDKDGNCVYYGVISQTFKNLSIKGGYINNVSFEPLGPSDLVPDVKLISIDKTKFGWREVKEIDVVYSLALTPSICKTLSARNDFISIGIHFYDNTGKAIDHDLDGGKALMQIDLPFQSVVQTP